MNYRSFAICCSSFAALLVVAVQSEAAYTLTPLYNGSNSATVAIGQSFSLNFDLTSDAADACDSAVFDVNFSHPGLVLDSYVWGDKYNGSGYDNSNPLASHYENFIKTGPTFGSGNLLTLNMTVPPDHTPPIDTITVHVLPGKFALGDAYSIPATGPDLTLNIVPEPASLTLLGMAGVAALAYYAFHRKKS